MLLFRLVSEPTNRYQMRWNGRFEAITGHVEDGELSDRRRKVI